VLVLKRPVGSREGAVSDGLGDFEIAAGLVVKNQVVRECVGSQRLEEPGFLSGYLLNTLVTRQLLARQGEVFTAQSFKGPYLKPLQSLDLASA